jgi:hypothetical protein
MTTVIDLAGLPALPLTDDLLEHPAFVSGNAAVVRAHIRLLRRAWCSRPAATLPADDAILSDVAGMAMAEFVAHRAVLLEGWALLDGGRLQQVTLAARAASIWALHSESLEQAAAAATAVGAAPAEFELIAQGQDACKVSKGKRELPRDFAVSQTVRQAARAQGFSAEQIASLFDDFVANARAKGWRYKNWDDALRLFIGRAPAMNNVHPEEMVSGEAVAIPRFGTLSRFGRPSRNEVLDQQNAAAVARVRALRPGA